MENKSMDLKEANQYCVDKLLKNISEIKSIEPFSSNLKSILNDGILQSDMIYRMVLLPFFEHLIENNNSKNQKIIDRILKLIEDLINNEEYYIRNPASDFIRLLADKFESVDKLQFLLPKSLELAKKRIDEYSITKAIIDSLFNRIEEFKNLPDPFKEDLEENIKYKNGIMIIFEDVVIPYFISLIENPNSENDKIAVKIAVFIEDMVNSSEQELISASSIALEALVAKLKVPKLVEKYLLPASLKEARRMTGMYLAINPNTWEKDEWWKK